MYVYAYIYVCLHMYVCTYGGRLDDVTHPNGVRTENELQIRQPVVVKSTNDLIAKVWHWKPTNHIYVCMHV
jgi:hypothetical protein